MAGEHQMTVPRIGMFCMVRNRPAVILDVRQFDGRLGREYVVTVSYNDNYSPVREQLLWNSEPHGELLEPSALPDGSRELMELSAFDAMVQSCRWSAGRPYIVTSGSEVGVRDAMSSPFYGAMEPDDYQLVPLLKALRMPRVNLMIADDVGLGKTIEAGLIINELLIRRRVNRVLILCPAALSYQWRDEMQEKFSLPFAIIDRATTAQLRNTVGLDVNPWRYHNRVIASYHYLRQELIREQFFSALRGEKADGTGQLPWDLLVVDEVHNLMPSSSGKDSELCEMLRKIVACFEHKIFLTATPHNGSTRSFTGLLEILDPARFRQTSEMQPKEKERVQQVVIRRLKRDINARTTPAKFSERKPPQELDLDGSLSGAEKRLNQAVEALKDGLRVEIARAGDTRRPAGNFALEVLGKRLLSCPMTFIDSWKRCKAGLEHKESKADVTDSAMLAIKRRLDGEITDDLEARELNNGAASRVGEWLRPFAAALSEQIVAVDNAIVALGIDMSRDLATQVPSSDARLTQLCQLIDDKLRIDERWRDDERLVIFTEYKTTQDYLLRQLEARYNDRGGQRIAILYGGMKDNEREEVKRKFNASDDAVRILLATDAASEGLNLQETARYLLHFDCPWNPSRLEQRNGRLDRHGQSRDVYTYHFFSASDNALKFFSHLIHKIDTIRSELGTVAEVFDEAVQQRLILGEDEGSVLSHLDDALGKRRGHSVDDGVADSDWGIEAKEAEARVQALASELDLDDVSRYNVLFSAMHGALTAVDAGQCFRISSREGLKAEWRSTLDQSLCHAGSTAWPALTFSIAPFMRMSGGRRVYRSREDLVMLHLGHPLMRRAMNGMTRLRYPGSNALSCFTATYGDIPDGCEAVVRLHLEEMAVNKLREAFHYWVHTFTFGIEEGTSRLLEFPHVVALSDRRSVGNRVERVGGEDISRALEIYGAVRDGLRGFILQRSEQLNGEIREQLEVDYGRKRAEEQERFKQRDGELSEYIILRGIKRRENEIKDLEAEVKDLETDFFKGEHDVIAKRRQKEARIAELKDANALARAHHDELRDELRRERDRIINQLLPMRYALDGELQLFPIAVEVVIPREK